MVNILCVQIQIYSGSSIRTSEGRNIIATTFEGTAMWEQPLFAITPSSNDC